MDSILKVYNNITTNYQRVGTRRENCKKKIVELLMLKYKKLTKPSED